MPSAPGNGGGSGRLFPFHSPPLKFSAVPTNVFVNAEGVCRIARVPGFSRRSVDKLLPFQVADGPFSKDTVVPTGASVRIVLSRLLVSRRGLPNQLSPARNWKFTYP